MILGVLSILAALLFFSLNPENHMFFPKCLVKEHLGIYCSGCGSQRALHDLMHLRIGKVFGHNALFLPFLMVVLHHVLVKVNLLKGKTILEYRYAPLIILGIVVVFTVVRNLDIYPFSYLAP